MFNEIGRGTRIKATDREEGGVPLITAGEQEQGIAEYIKENKELFQGESLTIDMFGNTFYRGYEFFADDNIIILRNNKFNSNVLQYICGTFQWLKDIYSYSKQFRMKELSKISIELPVLTSEDTTPYWDYMAYYIHNIQQQYADKLEVKSEYELDLMCQILGVTRDDIEQREEFTQPQYTNTFRVGGLFGVTGTKSTNAGTLEFKDCGVEFIGRTSVNNGVQGYIDELEYAPNEEGTITVSQVGTIVAQYRDMPYYTSQNIAKLEYIRKLSKEEGVYFVTCINKHLQLYGGYQTPKLDDIKNIILELPVISPNTKQIDWGTIRNVIIRDESTIWLLVKRYATEILW